MLAKDVLQSREVVENDAAALASRRRPSLLPWPPPDGPFSPYGWGTWSQGCAPIEAADRIVGHSVDHVVTMLRQLLFKAPIKAPRKPWALGTRAPSERPLSA